MSSPNPHDSSVDQVLTIAVLVALCCADLKRQTCLTEVRQGVDRPRCTIPFDWLYILVFVPLDGDVLAPEVEAIRSAEVVVYALSLVVGVAEVQRRLGGPESSSGSADLDCSADTLEVFLLSPKSIGLHFGSVASCLADRGDEDVEVAVVVDDDGRYGEGSDRESQSAEDGGEVHVA